MKRAITAAIAALLTFGGVYGLAASLNLTTGDLGAATVSVAACQATPLTATYTPAYSAAAPVGYKIGTVTVTGLDATCYNKNFRVTLADAASASLGESTGTTPGSGTSFAATFAPAIDASLIEGITVVLSG